MAHQQPPPTGSFIALVTDDPTFRHIVGTALERVGMPVRTCATERGVRDMLADATPAAVLLEASLGGDISGIGLVKALRRDRTSARMPIVVCSADEQVFLDLHLLELVQPRLRCAGAALQLCVDSGNAESGHSPWSPV